MDLREIRKILHAEILSENVDLSMDVPRVIASDLMSDVLAFSASGAILVTGLTNSQAVRTVEVADLCAIIFVRGKRPSEETVRLAEKRNIPLLTTHFPTFQVCGELYSHGLIGKE